MAESAPPMMRHAAEVPAGERVWMESADRSVYGWLVLTPHGWRTEAGEAAPFDPVWWFPPPSMRRLAA